MKKILLCSFFSVCLLKAVTIDELVKNTNTNNYDLKSIEKSIQIADFQIQLAKKWQNPILSLGLMDIAFNDLSAKDKKDMQSRSIGISQIVPTAGKLEIKERIAQKDKNIQRLNLEDKKLELESKIYEYAYNIIVLERKYKFLNEYEENIKKLESLFSSLYTYEKASQNDILNSQISSLEIKLQKQNLKNTIDNFYLQLEQLTYTKIDKIQEQIKINKIDVLSINEDHPKFQTLQESTNKSKNIALLESAKKIPDLQVGLTYFQKDDSKDDYVNLSLSFPLPIYKIEDATRLQAKMNTNETNDKLKQLKHNFKIESEIIKNTLNTSYENYNLIKQNILPIKQKIQQNLETYNSFDKIKPQESVNNLNELIIYETKAMDELQKYYEAYSKLIYFTNKGIK
ncbi:MAG: TolC family protein [Aliarcobacter sp.]|nr:TolC family protein [Aliarcobacter sp.]